jgi:hypothetical protein
VHLASLPAELADQPGIVDRLDGVTALARAPRGKADSRSSGGLRHGENGEPEGDEQEEAHPPAGAGGQHQGERSQRQSERDPTEQQAPATTATLDVLCSRRRQEHILRVPSAVLG